MSNTQKDIAISVRGVSKTFHLPHERHSGIKQLLINMLKGKHERGYSEQRVLNDVSFDIQKGDFFGIVGRNGSGKSTLLKIIAGIYEPDSGEVVINGSLVPFIELGVGFNPELTGRENVFMNGALLGFDHKQMDEMYDDIVKFAELEQFMDQKLKNYSSGMQVRLAFSIAIQADSDILVLDEVLAVGDEAFQRKCYEYFAQLKRNKKTVILVTHDMESAQRFCNKAIMIESGEIVATGDPVKVSQKYRELFMEEEDKGEKQEDGSIVNKNVDAHVTFKRSNGRWVFNVNVRPKEPIYDSVLALIVYRQDGAQVWNWASDYQGKSLSGSILEKDLRLTISVDDIFPEDTFYADLYIKAKDRSKNYALFEGIVEFEKRLPVTMHTYDRGWQPRMEVEIHNER